MPTFIDTHAHYFDRKYATLAENGDPATREAALMGADTLLSSPDFQSVTRAVINVGTNLENSRVAVEQAGKYPFMAVAVGIHPEDCQGLPDGAPLDPDTALKFALFGGDGGITDEMLDEVKAFAEFVKNKYKKD